MNQPVITSYSQSHVLQQRMKEEGLTHGQTVKANLSPVRLESNFGKMVMYFCPLHLVDVTENITPGDGGSLPEDVTLKGIEIPADLKPGLYELKNVNLFSNGTMQIIATNETEFEAVDNLAYSKIEDRAWSRMQTRRRMQAAAGVYGKLI